MAEKKLTRQQKEQVDTNLTLITTLILLYALVLGFIYQMYQSSVTLPGVQMFLNIMIWLALAAAIVCAAYGAYKSRPAMFAYCGGCVFLMVSALYIRYLGAHYHPFMANFAMLAGIFVFAQVFANLYVKGKYNGTAKVVFNTLAILAAVFVIGYLVVCYLLQVHAIG